MISRRQYQENVEYVINEFKKAGIAITEEEKNRIEVADFGLNCLDEIGDAPTIIEADRAESEKAENVSKV